MALQCSCWQVNLVSARKTLLQVTFPALSKARLAPSQEQISSLNSAKDVPQRWVCIRVPQTLLWVTPVYPLSGVNCSPPHCGSVCYGTLSVPQVCSCSHSSYFSCISDLRVLLSLQEKNPPKPKSKFFKSRIPQQHAAGTAGSLWGFHFNLRLQGKFK